MHERLFFEISMYVVNLVHDKSASFLFSKCIIYLILKVHNFFEKLYEESDFRGIFPEIGLRNNINGVVK